MGRMKLITKEIAQKLQAQYPHGNDLDVQKVIAKLFDPCSQWTFFLLNQNPENPDYIWAIVRGVELEIGSVSLKELEEIKNVLGLPLERDKYFSEAPAVEVYDKLRRGIHV